MALQALLAEGQPAAEGKSLVPVFFHSVQFWAPHHKNDTDILKQIQWWAAKMCGWSSWWRSLFSPKERWLQGEPPCCMQLLRGGHREDGTRVFSEVRSGRTRRNKDELEHEKFQLDTVIYFSRRGWSNTGVSRLPREAAIPSIPGVTQNQPAWGPKQPALLWPALSRRLTCGGPFPPVWFHVAVRFFGAVSERKS